MIPTGTLSFQASQPFRSSNDVSIRIDTIKSFLGKLGQKYSFKKESDSHHENPISTESSVNKVMETLIASTNDPATQSPPDNVVNEDSLIELFDQFPGLTSPMSD